MESNWVHSALRPPIGLIVPAQGDYDEGEIGEMMIGKGNRSTRRKPASVRFVHHKPHMLPGREPEPPRWEASD
jgi:hypothetical protein